ncbi:peptidase dimerization domain-containing protein [Nonomuraea angiospora]|uniref:peptidase dimerization domain-containing protein n=1 Tax=Nonomuraea angiospora TaxID=46172 RepID=UPI0037BA825D
MASLHLTRSRHCTPQDPLSSAGFFRRSPTWASYAAGSPESGRNALLAAAMATLAIMALPRYGSADTRLNVGTLVAGDGVNIVPSSAVLTCEARATDDEVVDELVDRIRSIVDGAARTQGVDAALVVTGRSATVTPDDDVVDHIVDVAAAHPGVAAGSAASYSARNVAASGQVSA